MTNFKDFPLVYEEVTGELKAAQEKFDSARGDAICYIQDIINKFKIRASDLVFEGAASTPCAKASEDKKRKSARPKYELPNGETCTGKGLMKKSFKEYLDKNGLTKDDLDQFLVPEKPEEKSEE